MTEPDAKADIHITYDDAIRLMSEAVEAKGRDFVYRPDIPDCHYTIDNEPDCLVGCALANAGVSIDTLNEMSLIIGSEWDYLFDNGIHISSHALTAFEKAQTLQDRRNTWGEALDAAKAL